jgi:hypothetical protein
MTMGRRLNNTITVVGTSEMKAKLEPFNAVLLNIVWYYIIRNYTFRAVLCVCFFFSLSFPERKKAMWPSREIDV